MSFAHHNRSFAPAYALDTDETVSLQDCLGQNTAHSFADPDPFDYGSDEPQPEDTARRYQCGFKVSTRGIVVTSPRSGRTRTVSLLRAPAGVLRAMSEAVKKQHDFLMLTAADLREVSERATPPVLLHGGWLKRRTRNRRRSA